MLAHIYFILLLSHAKIETVSKLENKFGTLVLIPDYLYFLSIYTQLQITSVTFELKSLYNKVVVLTDTI
jgi:hypothetical protein